VAANAALNGDKFTLNQADKQGISGFDIGNPALKQEKGKSFTFGVVVTPKSFDLLRNFTFTADYFNIKVEDAIDQPPRQFILDQCYGGGDQSFCKFVVRRPNAAGSNSAGSIEFINAVSENSGGLYRRGLDLTFTYAEKVGPGRLTATGSWTHLLKSYDVPRPGADRDYLDGEIGTPRDKVMLNLGYDWQDWSLRTTTTYIASSAIDDQFLSGYDLPRNAIKIASKTYVDMQLQYKIGKAAQIYLGIDNLFDTKAPLIPSGIPGNTTGAETDAGTYDPIGRRYYVGLRYKF
jgi:iron complex outermembrane receptor protein